MFSVHLLWLLSLATRSAELFLKRMHRPLLPCDLDPRESAVGNLMKNDLVLQKLAAHPLLRQIAGNPGEGRGKPNITDVDRSHGRMTLFVDTRSLLWKEDRRDVKAPLFI